MECLLNIDLQNRIRWQSTTLYMERRVEITFFKRKDKKIKLCQYWTKSILIVTKLQNYKGGRHYHATTFHCHMKKSSHIKVYNNRCINSLHNKDISSCDFQHISRRFLSGKTKERHSFIKWDMLREISEHEITISIILVWTKSSKSLEIIAL